MGTLGNREVKRNNDGNARATSIKKWHRELNSDHESSKSLVFSLILIAGLKQIKIEPVEELS